MRNLSKVVSLLIIFSIIFTSMSMIEYASAEDSVSLTEANGTINESELSKDGNADLNSTDGMDLQDDTYQYYVDNDDYCAFMWVPESAENLNGVMIAKSNLIEGRLLESVTVRDVLAKYNIGVIYLHARPTTDRPSNSNIMGDFVYIGDEAMNKYKSANGYTYDGPANAGSTLDEMLAKFASVSGYDELKYAPIIGAGHSAGMGLGRALGSWNPSRALAQICLKGGAQQIISGVTKDGVGDNYEIQPGVPTYYATGQFTEHSAFNNPAGKDNYIDGELPNFTKIRAKGTDRLLTASVEWESGHYDWGESSNEAVANYLDNIIPARLGNQATSGAKINEDYSLTDISDDGYVSDVKVLGSKSMIYDESTYNHGDVSEFTEAEQKNMIWFVNEEQYKFIRDFTADRKDFISVDNNLVASVTYDRSYQNSNGNFSEWPPGNICYYISDTQSVAMEFDISNIKDNMGDEGAKLSIPQKSGMTNRNININLLSTSPWDENRMFSIPSSDNMTLIASGVTSSAISNIDVTDIVNNAIDNKIYLLLNSTDSGSGSDFYCTTEYDEYTNGSLTTDITQLPAITAVSAEVTPTTKHQYLQMEDPSTGNPKSFTRIMRYDLIGANNSSYEKGIADDPMTFGMIVDKMSIVSPDRVDLGYNVPKVNTPAYLVPAMAPLEWVGVKEVETNANDLANNVSSKWLNIMRWRNNRVFYHMTAQDSYVNLNTFDVYDNNDSLQYSRATNTYQLPTINAQSGSPQTISFDDVANVQKDFESFIINPTTNMTDQGYGVDVMVDYGPIKATQNSGGGYTITKNQLPDGASYPVECKLVATQFGSTVNGVRMADPVEKIFYIYDPAETGTGIDLANGTVNQNMLLMNGITGFEISGVGADSAVILSMDSDTQFNAETVVAISDERNNTTDINYAKHYKYPDGYNPYDYWNDYPGEYKIDLDKDSFVTLSEFINTDNNRRVNLRYINKILANPGLTITPTIKTPALNSVRINPWGTDAVNIVWQGDNGFEYDSLKVEYSLDGNTYSSAEQNEINLSSSNAVVSNIPKGKYTFKVSGTYNGSEGIETYIDEVNVGSKKYLVEDFETGDLTSGNNWLKNMNTTSGYAASSYMGEALLLSTDSDTNNHYLAMQNTYTNYTQTADITIPGGLNDKMNSLSLDIKVDKLEDTQPSGQVYFELYNPTTGVSYGIQKGDDFSLDDKSWHMNYSIGFDEFKLPTDSETLSQITVLKIGRKVVGGGNNNRRAKIYLDNISLSEQSAYHINNLETVTGNDTLSMSWDEPGVPYSSISVYLDGNTTPIAILPSGVTGFAINGLAEGTTHTVQFNVNSKSNVEYDNDPEEITILAIDDALVEENTASIFNDINLNSSNTEVVSEFDGKYWSLIDSDNIAIDISGSKFEDFYDVCVYITEENENGETFVAPIGTYITEDINVINIPISAFKCISVKNNGEIDLSSLKYIKVVASITGDETINIKTTTANKSLTDNKDIEITKVEESGDNAIVSYVISNDIYSSDYSMLLASYDSNEDVLIDSKIATEISGEVSLAKGEVYKAFYWDIDNVTPITESNTYSKSSSDVYSISVIQPTNGTVTVQNSAKSGEIVTVEVIGSKVGDYTYNVSDYGVTDSLGNVIPVINGHFRMPSSDINIEPKMLAYNVQEKTLNAVDTISIKSNGYQDSSDLVMIGRGRIGFIKYDLTGIVGNVTSAVINGTCNRGTASSVGIFLAENNDWTGWFTYGGSDKSLLANHNTLFIDNLTTLGAFGESKINMFQKSGVGEVYVDYDINASADNDPSTSKEDQLLVAASASKGALENYFYGDTGYISAGAFNIDVTNTINAAVKAGKTTATLMLYTPYTFSGTIDVNIVNENPLSMDITAEDKKVE